MRLPVAWKTALAMLSRPVGERVIYFPGNLLGGKYVNREDEMDLLPCAEMGRIRAGAREGAARMSRRPVVRPAAEGYSLSSGAPCTSRG
jgi:hypothetical protein